MNNMHMLVGQLQLLHSIAHPDQAAVFIYLAPTTAYASILSFQARPKVGNFPCRVLGSLDLL